MISSEKSLNFPKQLRTKTLGGQGRLVQTMYAKDIKVVFRMVLANWMGVFSDWLLIGGWGQSN